MENVKAAIKAIETALPRARTRRSAEIDASISHLSTLETIFNLSSVSPLTFRRLAEILRCGIQPLYKQNMQLTLRLALVVFETISNSNVHERNDYESNDVKEGWEMAVTALFAGILDYMEDNPSSKVKAAIGDTFYEALCRQYFSETAYERVPGHKDLVTTVYMLLSESLIGQNDIIAKLRTQIGGARLGFTLWNTRALLELFANMIPHPKHKESRTQFIQEVFDPAVFPCATNLVNLVNSGKRWDVIGCQVIDLFAAFDLAFPQPFVTSCITIGASDERRVARIYADKLAFLASFDQVDKVETLAIPYEIVKDIRISQADDDATVTVSLSGPPVIGKDPISLEPSKSFAKWVITHSDVERFTKSLTKRNLSVKTDKRFGRKLSIAEGQIELDANKSPPRTTQEKVCTIAKLWGQSTPLPSSRGGIVISSPPITSIFPPASEDVMEDALCNKTPETVFIDGNGDLYAQPDNSHEQSKAVRAVEGTKPDQVVFKLIKPTQDRDDDVQPRRTFKRARAVVLSGSEDDTGSDFMRTPSPKKTKPLKLSSERKTRQTRRKTAQDKKESLQDAGTSDAPLVITSSPPPVGQKRQSKEEERSEIPQTPLKRARRSATPDVKIEVKPPARALRSTRAFKKDPPVHLVTVPDATVPSDFLKPVVAKNDKSRASTPASIISAKAGMRNKSGQRTAPEKQPRRQPSETPGNESVKRKLVVEEELQPIVKFDAQGGNRSFLSGSGRDKNPIRPRTPLSSRKDEIKVQVSAKKKKAPWETSSFLQTMNPTAQSSPGTPPGLAMDSFKALDIRPSSPSIEEIEGFPEMDTEEPQDVSKTFIEEYTVPVKPVSPESSPIKIIPRTPCDATMIDLAASHPSTEPPNLMPRVKICSDKAIQTIPSRPLLVSQKPAEIPSGTRSQEKPKPVEKVSKLVFTETPPQFKTPEAPKHRASIIEDESTKPREDRHHVLPTRSKPQEPQRNGWESTANRNQLDNNQVDRAVLQVLNTMHDELVKRVFGKFEEASHQVDQGKRSILRAAAESMEQMRIEGVRHFNNLVDLEAEYGSHRKRISTGMSAYHDSTQHVTKSVKSILKDHGQAGLSKKLPPTLFSKPFSFKANK
ncbi:hypothetical protein FA15DRAFT_755062 [Coprinopsis marcescibilis]|uniref:Uncharacterized protein n=1 Tax=Coprinopsis marcescibilis TaxID=230819 RepID=A0A5C3LD97_COPMA|nr:hypothetical protein FA15DRAFT_755062 [Coprinopsis marcescibilis]